MIMPIMSEVVLKKLNIRVSFSLKINQPPNLCSQWRKSQTHRDETFHLFIADALMQWLCIMCLQEELNVALFHIKDVSGRQREVQKRIEMLQSESSKEIISVPHRFYWNILWIYLFQSFYFLSSDRSALCLNMSPACTVKSPLSKMQHVNSLQCCFGLFFEGMQKDQLLCNFAN